MALRIFHPAGIARSAIRIDWGRRPMSVAFDKLQATPAAGAAGIVPRAEFRVFGQGVIDTVKERMWNGKTVLFQARRMPAETYILSANTNEANVKVRDGLLDIKTKVGETPEGYEIFRSSARISPRSCLTSRPRRC
jgi:hypothetical protein